MAHSLPGQTHSQGGAGSDQAGQGESLLQATLRRDQAVGQPGGIGVLGRERLSGQDQLHSPVGTEGARQALRPACPRHDAQLDLRLGKTRRLRGDDEIALHRQLAAPTVGVAIDRRNQRRVQAVQALPVSARIELHNLGWGGGGHDPNIGPGCKCAPFTGEDDHPYLRVRIQSFQRIAKGGEHHRTERVERLRAVEIDHRSLFYSFG